MADDIREYSSRNTDAQTLRYLTNKWGIDMNEAIDFLGDKALDTEAKTEAHRKAGDLEILTKREQEYLGEWFINLVAKGI